MLIELPMLAGRSITPSPELGWWLLAGSLGVWVVGIPGKFIIRPGGAVIWSHAQPTPGPFGPSQPPKPAAS
jgi:hypothetical protein